MAWAKVVERLEGSAPTPGVGPQGPKGETGATGPQGPAGADGTGGGTGWRLLTGLRPPVSVLNDPPTDGTWRWSDESQAWFSPAYEVSWQAGDNTGVVPYMPGLGGGAVQPSTLVGAGPFASDQPAEGIPQYDWNASFPDGRVTTATEAGSGIVFLITEEEGFGGPTAPPRPDLDVLDYLGDLVLTNGTTPIPWALDSGTGADGDFYLYGPERTLYGPRADGFWGQSVKLNVPTREIELSASGDVPIITGYAAPDATSDLVTLYTLDPATFVNRVAFRVSAGGEVHAMGGVVLTSPSGTPFRLSVADDGTLSTEPA